MLIGSGTAAVIALALIATGDVHGAGLGSDQAGRPTWPWRLTQQAEPSTPPAQPAAPLEQPAQEKAPENTPSGAPSPPAANAPPAAPPAGTPAVVLDDQEVSGIVGKSVRSSADEDMGRIVDVIVSQDGHIRAAIIDFGATAGRRHRGCASATPAREIGPIVQKPLQALREIRQLAQQGGLERLDGKQRNQPDHRAHFSGTVSPSGR